MIAARCVPNTCLEPCTLIHLLTPQGVTVPSDTTPSASPSLESAAVSSVAAAVTGGVTSVSHNLMLGGELHNASTKHQQIAMIRNVPRSMRP